MGGGGVLLLVVRVLVLARDSVYFVIFVDVVTIGSSGVG
jgi:hypothetical protein